MAQRTLRDLFLDTLRDTYNAEAQLVKALPKMAKAANNSDLKEGFEEHIFPVLTPLAVDPGHPFPYISNLSLNLAVQIADPDSRRLHFARVKVPPLLRRFASPEEGVFVPLEDVIAAHLDRLFPGMRIVDHYAFRVTRNNDLEVDDDGAEDLLEALEETIRKRRFSPAVRSSTDNMVILL